MFIVGREDWYLLLRIRCYCWWWCGVRRRWRGETAQEYSEEAVEAADLHLAEEKRWWKRDQTAGGVICRRMRKIRSGGEAY